MIYLKLFLTFLKIGAFTFGGGYAMLPLIEEEVIANGWMTMPELINFVAVSESTPGPFAVNISTYVGAETAGILGSFCATFGVILPSFIIILIVAKCFTAFKNSIVVNGCLSGLKPAVIGLIGVAAISVGQTVLFFNGVSLDSVLTFKFCYSVIILIATLIMAFKKVHPILIIIISAVSGIGFGYIENLII